MMTNAIKRFGASTSMLAVTGAVGVTALGLVTLTVMKHYEDTPEIKTLACALSLPRTDCPAYGAKLNRLEAEIEAMQLEKNQIEGRLSALSAIERSVDQVTLFETKTDPESGFEITVGTVYRTLTNAAPQPDHYFCYVKLENGPAGESRNLHFQVPSGPINVPASSLREAGVDADVLAFGRSVCTPFLIGKAL